VERRHRSPLGRRLHARRVRGGCSRGRRRGVRRRLTS
jgi:hypothetical protein